MTAKPREHVLHAIAQCETVHDALDGLEGLGRTDTRRRETILRMLGRLTDAVLADLDRRGRYLARPDGYPTRTSGAGDGGRGEAELTSVEAAANHLTGDASHLDGSVVWFRRTKDDDGVGEAVQKVFTSIERMARLANQLDAVSHYRDVLRPMAGIAGTAERSLDFVLHVGAKARGRQSTLSGPCQCCGREVAGTEKDRMRSGMCHADYTAWCRDGRPERAPWMDQRRNPERESVA